MNKIIAVTLLVASTAMFPVVTPTMANSSTNALCGPDAPEGYKRPGGYCEQIDSNNSLHEGRTGCSWEWLPLASSLQQGGKPLIVADNCDYYYHDYYIL